MRPIVISMGDPAGIGPEVIAKAWSARHDHALPPFVAIGDPASFRRVCDGPIAEVGSLSDGVDRFDAAFPVLPVARMGESIAGQPDAGGARCALESLEYAVALVHSGEARALVTGPVSKAQLYAIGFIHPGQTEFVADRCGIAPDDAVMMLAGPTLRVVPITTHVPMASVAGLLTIDLLVTKARVTAHDLTRHFGIAKPRLAFAGFNPHAGESGALGREEIDIIAPAIERLRAEGIDATGPFAADTLFHAPARARYDVAMCCYHDQALVPVKTLHFDDGVNITLGLPIVRTSPDHGTAFGIAGRGLADAGATIAAIRMADQASRRHLPAGAC